VIEKFIDLLTRTSLRFKWVIIALSVFMLGAGVLAITELNQELLPNIEYPQTILMALDPGVSVEEMRDRVTIPIEEAVAGFEEVVNTESTTYSGVSVVILKSDFGVELDTLREDLKVTLDGMDFPQGMETPELLTFSFSDIPLAALGVSSPGQSLDELKDLVEGEIVPALEGVAGVANVDVSGGQELPTAPPPSPEPTDEPEQSAEPTAAPSSTPTENPTTPTETAEEEGVPLPDSWIQAGAAQNMTIETTDDLTAEIAGGIASFAPQMLEDLTPEMLLAMPIEALAALPESYLETLDSELQESLAERLAAQPEPEDTGALPSAWKAAGQTQGLTLEFPEDVSAEIFQAISSFAPQLLHTLTPENMRRFSPEVLGWFPEDFILDLDESLRAELDSIAESVGGLGALAAQAEELAANAPELSGLWREGSEESAGVFPTFETAADLFTTGFTESAAELLNLLVDSGQAQAPQLMADLTPDVILWLTEKEENFLQKLNPATLRLLSPEVLGVLPEDFLETLDADLRSELEGIASGTAEAFIPLDTINRIDGNVSLGLTVYKDNEANTVSTAHG
jgi:hypothetical protein